MTEEVLPEIRTAATALERSITNAEIDIMQMKMAISAKEKLIFGWRDMIKTLIPNDPPRKNRFFSRERPADQPLTTTAGVETK
jgi:hypothetical protein